MGAPVLARNTATFGLDISSSLMLLSSAASQSPGSLPDSDGDGLSDADEADWGTDPFWFDTDNDGLWDGEEVWDFGADPHHYDTDQDGVSDFDEVFQFGTGPTDPNSNPGSVGGPGPGGQLGDYCTSTDFFDLQNLTVIFTPVSLPDPSGTPINSYTICVVPVPPGAGFPQDPSTHRPLDMGDDDFRELTITQDQKFKFFGQDRTSLFVGSNGYITFLQGDGEFNPNLDSHFKLPRIAALYTDLTPFAGGTAGPGPDVFVLDSDGDGLPDWPRIARYRL